MTTARSFGNYDLAAALADIADNSIQAGAANVWISFDPVDDDVTVRIRDDGRGMPYAELVAALRPASRNPDEQRDIGDLGRFGWGLKSASLSQARVLTVVSWQGDEINAGRWDIDDLDEWSMHVFQGPEAEALLGNLRASDCGTEVIWTRCDRLYDIGLNATIDERLNDKISQARKQLALIFHRYLAGDGGSRLAITVQGIPLEPADPFLSSHPATQSLDEEVLPVRGSETIRVRPYVIPHFSKLTVEQRNLLGGPEGLVRNQGFYVYRNRRLIIYGTWFRLVPHGELSQLTRIRVDLPNTLDTDWKITLDKSDAQLPVNLRRRLREVVQRFSRRSVSVHRHRGVDLEPGEKAQVWKRNVHSGRIRYQINRQHPVIRQMLAQAGDSFVALEALKVIEACVPVNNIAQDAHQADAGLVQTITDPVEFDSLILACWIAYLGQKSGSPSATDFLAFAKRTEPISGHWKYAESYIKEKVEKEWSLNRE